MKTNRSGFTLVEMAIVLVIVGFLLSGGGTILSSQLEMRRVQETNALLSEVREALIGFAIANGRLPCPAPATTATGSVGAGLEEATGIGSALACTNAKGVGVVPWATLGVSEVDSWGRRFTYRVTLEFARGATGQTVFAAGCVPPSNPQNAAFALCSNGTMNVISTGGGSTVALNVPAVVISHGKNGNGAYTSQGAQLGAGADAGELDNQLTTGGANMANLSFVSKTPTATFDDLVSWISQNILSNRMVAAGRLP